MIARVRVALLVFVAVAAGQAGTAAVAVAAAPNDSFASASVLSGNPVTATGSNVDATAEPGEPAHSEFGGGHSVWWRWVAPAAGAATVDTCDSGFDTVLAIYTGTNVAALARIGANDDACELQSSVTFVAAPGQEYRIAVDGSGEDVGAIALQIRPTLAVAAQRLVRAGRLDATRFFIQAAPGDDLDSAPRLVLEREGRRISVDLELENEGDFDSTTDFRYTFVWACTRAGTWRWTVTVDRGGTRVAQKGTFAVPRCVRRNWYVSRAKVVRDFARDFDRQTARALRCRPLGARRGSRAATWRCRLVRPGYVCTGGFRFRYRAVFQGSDRVRGLRSASGGVTCRR